MKLRSVENKKLWQNKSEIIVFIFGTNTDNLPIYWMNDFCFTISHVTKLSYLKNILATSPRRKTVSYR